MLAAIRFEVWRLRRNSDDLQVFVTAPLFTIIFVGIALSSGRRDLVPAAALGAALISLWGVCVGVGGSLMSDERSNGTFEQLVSTTAPFRLIVFGRITTLMALALLAVPEVWLVTAVVFGIAVPVPHPGLFVGALLMTVAGLHAATQLIAATCVLARVGVIFQNALAYPFYLLGGLLVPTSALPGWMQPLTRLVFLSWGSDLLRAAISPTTPSHVARSFVGLAVTSVVTGIVGQVLIGRTVNRVRVNGTVGAT